MTFLPIVERELRVRSRLKSTYRFRIAGAALAMILVTFMLMSGSVSTSPGRIGAAVFTMMAWMAFIYCLTEGARNTADCLSEEKRAGTLGLLFLTDLKGYDVVLGKMVATSLNSFYALLAILPPLGLPFLLGGVTSGEFWRLILMLLNTLFLSLTVGLFVSAISRDGQRAWTAAYLVILALALLAVPAAALNWLHTFTPTSGFLAIWDGTYRRNPGQYWTSLIGTNLMSWLLLVSASIVLPRAWQERPKRLLPGLARRGVALPFQTNDQRRIRLRRKFLSLNPALWAALPRSSQYIYVWMVIGAACLAGIIALVAQPASKSIGPILFGSALIFHFLLTIWVATEASHLFPDARQSGALELLMCTPLTVKEIVEGHFAALFRLFFGPVVALLAAEIVLVFVYITTRAYSMDPVNALLITGLAAVSIAVFILDLHAVARYGMWMGLKSRRAGIAITKTVLFVMILPYMAVPLCWFFFFWPIGVIVKNLIFINYAQDQLARQFRKVATDRMAGAEHPLLKRRLPSVLPA